MGQILVGIFMFPGITDKDSKWDACFQTLMVSLINSIASRYMVYTMVAILFGYN